MRVTATRRANLGALLLAGLRILAVLTAAATIPGCERGPGEAAPSGQPFIAVVGAGEDDPIWPVLSGSAQRTASQLMDMGVRVAAPPSSSVNAQIQLVQRLQTEGMRGLCIQVIDPVATDPLLRRLANAGVVVVSLMRPVSGSGEYLHSGPDELRIGEMLADLTAEALKQSGTLAVLHADSIHAHSVERRQAFNERMRNYPRISVLREFDCAADPVKARALIADCMQRYPRLNGWVAIDNWPLRGLGSEPLLPPGCKLISVNPTPAVWDALADGRCHALVAAPYDAIAQRAVERCAMALEGKLARWRSYYAEPFAVWGANLHAYKLDWIRWCAIHPEP